MTLRCGKYFYQVEHQKPSLLDLPPGCDSILKKKEEIYDYDFKKFMFTSYQSSSIRTKRTISSNSNDNNNNFYNNTNNPYGNKKKNYYSSNLNGLNFDYNNLQIESNYDDGSTRQRNDRYDSNSKDDNFFTNKISMNPPRSDNIFREKSSNADYNNRNSTRQNNYNNDNYNSNNFNSNNYNSNNYNRSNYNSNYDSNTRNGNGLTDSNYNSNVTNNYNSSRNQHNINSQPKVSSIEHYDYQAKTSSAFPNNSQTTNHAHQSKSSKKYSSNANLNSGGLSSNTNKMDQNVYTSKPNSSSKAKLSSNTNLSSNNNYQSNTNFSSKPNLPSSTNLPSRPISNLNTNQSTTTNTTYTSKINTSSKVNSITPSTLNTNVIENSRYSKKAPVYDYSKPIPSSTYEPDSSSRTKSFKNSTSKSSNVSTKVGNRSNFNIDSQPPSIPSKFAGSSSRSKYTSTSSMQSTNTTKVSSSSINHNSQFTKTSDLLNQHAPRNLGDTSQLRSQAKTINSTQKSSYYDEVRTPNLTQYVRPTGGKSSTNVGLTTSTTTNEAQFIAHQAHYAGNTEAPINPPSALLAKKNAISNPGYDFLQPDHQNFSQSQSQSMMNEAANDSFTIDPVPKKTRVEFPEPQTAPKPFQMIDVNLEGEVSQEDAKKVEDLNELMKSFNADSENEDEINGSKLNKKNNKPLITADDLKKGIFSSSEKYFEEEEEEAQIEDVQGENEINNQFQPLENLSDLEDIEKKSKDFDNQNFFIGVEEEEEENVQLYEEENKLEIASGEETPNNSTLPKEQVDIMPIEDDENNELLDEDDLAQSSEIQSILDKFKKTIGDEEEEDENTYELIKHLEEEEETEDKNRQNNNIEEILNKQKTNNDENPIEDKTVEDPFLEEEENESMIEKVDVDINLSDDENNNNINNDNEQPEEKKEPILKDNFLNNINGEEEESFNYSSLEEILRRAKDQHMLSDGNEEDEEEEAFIYQENKTPTSHFKKPLQFLSQNIKNKYAKSNGGITLAHEFADRLLKIQLKKILYP